MPLLNSVLLLPLLNKKPGTVYILFSMINPAVSQELVIFITIGFDGVNILGMEGLFQAQECEEEENLFHIWLYYSSYDIICFLSGLSVCQFLFQLIRILHIKIIKVGFHYQHSIYGCIIRSIYNREVSVIEFIHIRAIDKIQSTSFNFFPLW
jgi:hypothetical protein